MTVGIPIPCLSVNLSGGVGKGHAVIRPPFARTEVLIVPTAPIVGIESPALIAPDAPRFFETAWEARRYVIEALGRDPGRAAIGMAVNSASGRSQDRFHIHVDCLWPGVRAKLDRFSRSISERWAPFPVRMANGHYWARRMSAAEFERSDPVASVIEGVPRGRRPVSDMTLAVVGTTFEDGTPGFFLLANVAGPGAVSAGRAENLIDHACRIASR
jgi:CDP-diacylglycerol pyrophosphatase